MYEQYIFIAQLKTVSIESALKQQLYHNRSISLAVTMTQTRKSLNMSIVTIPSVT